MSDERKPRLDFIVAEACWRADIWVVQIEDDPDEGTHATVFRKEEGEESADRFQIAWRTSVDTMVQEAILHATGENVRATA